ALLGTSSFLIGAIASPLVGIAGEDSAVPMAVVQLGAALVAMACFATLCRPGRGRARADADSGTGGATGGAEQPGTLRASEGQRAEEGHCAHRDCATAQRSGPGSTPANSGTWSGRSTRPPPVNAPGRRA